MGDKKKIAKMDKVKLLETLCQLTEENERLTKRASGLEAANAELVLRSHEQDEQVRQAREQAADLMKELTQVREELRREADARQAMPMGSFADALLQTREIAQRTQQAADEYLDSCLRKVNEAQEQAEEIIRTAEEKAMALVREAEEHCAQLRQQEADIRSRVREHAAEISRLAAQMDEEDA